MMIFKCIFTAIFILLLARYIEGEEDENTNKPHQLSVEFPFLNWTNLFPVSSNLSFEKLKDDHQLSEILNQDIPDLLPAPKKYNNLHLSIGDEKMLDSKNPVKINFVINLNFMNENDGKKARNRRNPRRRKIRKKKLHLRKSSSDRRYNIFKKPTVRNKRQVGLNTEYVHKSIDNLKSEITFSKDSPQQMKNWEDILAVNPILRTEKPTKPEVEYIDEWKYSYRVTIYNLDDYEISNFVCSGVLVAPQWVITSKFCDLRDNLIIVIGVHTLPRVIPDYNKYSAQKKIYSLQDDLELIQMDRPVEWKFLAADIRSVGISEMKDILQNGKCKVLSWVAVDLEEEILELREYPELTCDTTLPYNKLNESRNCLQVNSVQDFGLCKRDLGSPVLCDGMLSGIVLNVADDCRNNLTLELLCPVLEWVTFFTGQASYFELTARKWSPNNSGVEICSSCFVSYFLLYWTLVLMK